MHSQAVHRIAIGTPLTEGKANVYLLPGDPVTIVDAGINTTHARRELEDTLANHGLSVEDVDHVLLTHYHADHGGLAGWIQTETDATVFAHEGDADRVDPTRDQWFEICTSQYDRLQSWGVPESKLQDLRAVNDDNHRFHSDPVDVDPLTHGDTVAAGSSEIRAVHTPGHTAGSCCYELAGGSAFTGDTLLPVYTPNIGGADMRLADPIGTYLQSLRLLASRRLARAYPGHRRSIERPSERASEISRHHLVQARTLLAALAERGTADVWTLTQDLFVDVGDIHVVLGMGETYAHLRHLESLDIVRRHPEGYALADSEMSSDRLEAAWPL